MTTKTTAEDVIRSNAEAWNSHDVTRIGQHYAQDATVVDPQYPAPLVGREAIKKDASDFFVACPDMRFQVTKVIADGSSVAVEGSASGTHSGPLQLPSGLLPATNKRLEFDIAFFMRLDDAGIIQEERRYYDVAGVLMQLGVLQ
jgi:steroid delta-isomerase-like uncharacterized protein